jgi:hypothetical protein
VRDIGKKLASFAASDAGKAIGADVMSSIKSIGVSGRTAIHSGMTASEAFDFFRKNIVPEAISVGQSLLTNGPELDVSGILSNLDDRALKDGLRKDPNDASVRTVLKGMDLITFDNSDTRQTSASTLISQLEGDARRALSVMAPGSRFENTPDLNMEEPAMVSLRGDCYLYEGPDMAFPERLAISQGAVTVVDEIHLPSPQALVVRVRSNTTSLCTNLSVLAPAALSDNVARLPAGTIWCSVTQLKSQVRFVETPVANAQYALDGTCGVKFNDIGQNYVYSSLDSGLTVYHYVFSSKEQFTVSVSTSGPAQCLFEIIQYSPAMPSVPSTGGESVLDHVGTASMGRYAPYVLTIQSFFGDCLFDPTCLAPKINAYYIASVKDSGSNPDTLPDEYTLLTTYCQTINPTTGASHPFSGDQLRLLYSFLYSLLVMQADLAFVNPTDVNNVARIQDANLQTYNTAPIMTL